MVDARPWVRLWLVAAAAAAARELDPAACGARFDVQHDKIIRTEESREMGARYLSELDVGSRDECRRLCCETDACDVFVYEEKSPGSCYLFKCGPPEDFRCKFTTHGNFSSGVLALSRRLAELQDQEHQHTPPHAVPASPAAPAPPPAPPSPPLAPAQPPVVVPQSPLRSGRCSRYQFECHSGGECVAVYNACDGIPQCSDGSDEAPELACPAAPEPAPGPQQGPPPGLQQGPPPAPQPAAPDLGPAARPPPAPHPHVTHLHTHPHTPPPQQRERLQEMNDALISNSQLGGAGPLAAEAGAEAAWPHRLAQAQPRGYPGRVPVLGENDIADPGPAPLGSLPRLPELAGPRIFSHQGGLLQDPAPAWRWPQQPQPNLIRPRLPTNGMDVLDNMAGEWGDRGWPAPAQVPQMAELPPFPAPPELAVPLSAPHALRDAAKKGPGGGLGGPGGGLGGPGGGLGGPGGGTARGEQAPPAPPPAPTTSPAPPTTTTKPTPAPTTTYKSLVGAAPLLSSEEDGPSERPPAAMLLLVLGVCMWCVVCGVWWRRGGGGRRRRPPRAQQHDYLVNGMYL